MPTPVPGNSLNKTTANPSKPHSNFDLSKLVAITPRFGVNTPFYSNEVVTDDGKIVIKPSCDTRSYTLKAPLFGNIKKHIAFYQVPLQCLLPFNYQKIVVNSQHGSDVQGSFSGSGLIPALDGVNCVVSDFSKRLVTKFVADFAIFQPDIDTDLQASNYSDAILHILEFVIRWEMFFSHGNLMSHLGVHYGHILKFCNVDDPLDNITFDSFCQRILAPFEVVDFKVTSSDNSKSIRGSGAKHIRKVLDFCRTVSMPITVTVYGNTKSISPESPSNYSLTYVNPGESSEPYNFGRCLAYQIVNAHFYTNDKIDYVYSADLFRDYISSLITAYALVSHNIDFESSKFTYNGINCRYDWLSGYYFNLLLNAYVSSTYSYKERYLWQYLYPYFNAIFGFNYSLRFMDYFVGARPRNLAISGPNSPTDVAIDNNKVSVINTTKAIVAQRFLNAVARVPQNFKDYSDKILGQTPAYDWHDPKYLFSYDMDLFTSEVENTGSGQLSDPNSVTSVLRGRAGNLQFEISNVDRYSYIVGIENFDFRRFYFTTQDKNTMSIDRFDMFIPELQYLGDQSLKRSELIAGYEKDVPFGYQLRDMQYKQTFDECSGGFVENLPGWLFKFDPFEFSNEDVFQLTISPDFIRCKPEEIDDFYLSLTGLTLASYFHFIEVWNIQVSVNRPMVAAPSIL